ncbi:MAG: hypothetical protein KDC92_15760 [Bacteroidetes bacterium]|nr:hypothetical protein [Bacteroidota bacterium]
MMFDFWNFYKGLLQRTDYFDDYWDTFPKGRHMRFKSETLALLEKVINTRNSEELASVLSIIYNDGADRDFTRLLLRLLKENWHKSEEDVVGILELIKDPLSVGKLYEVAINIPDYDDMRALAKKCMWALSSIETPEAIEKLKLLKEFDDPIIRENASFHLDTVANKPQL